MKKYIEHIHTAPVIQENLNAGVNKFKVVEKKGSLRYVFLNLGSAIGLCALLYLILLYIIAGYQEFCYNVDLVQKLYWYRSAKSSATARIESYKTQEDEEGFETNV